MISEGTFKGSLIVLSVLCALAGALISAGIGALVNHVFPHIHVMWK